MIYTTISRPKIIDTEDLSRYLRTVYTSISSITIFGSVMTITFGVTEVLTLIETYIDNYCELDFQPYSIRERSSINIQETTLTTLQEIKMTGSVHSPFKNTQLGNQNIDAMICKNDSSVLPSKIHLSGTKSNDYNTNLGIHWAKNDNIELNKNKLFNDGSVYYPEIITDTCYQTNISLSSTSNTVGITADIGAYVIILESDVGTGIHAIAKNMSNILPTITTLVNSPPNNIEVAWGVSSNITICASLPGDYLISTAIPIENQYVYLSGNTWATIPGTYIRYTGLIIIRSAIASAPCCIVSITNNGLNYGTNHYADCRGGTNSERLEVRCINSRLTQIQIRKNKSSGLYNGIYKVSMVV